MRAQYLLSPQPLSIEIVKLANQDLYKLFKQEYMRQVLLGDGTRFPVVMFPGFMSSQLESWTRKECNGADIEIMDQVS